MMPDEILAVEEIDPFLISMVWKYSTNHGNEGCQPSHSQWKAAMPGESIFLTIGDKIRWERPDMELIKENHKKINKKTNHISTTK